MKKIVEIHTRVRDSVWNRINMMLVTNTCIVNLERKCRICAGDLLDLTCAIPIFSGIYLDEKIQRYLYIKVNTHLSLAFERLTTFTCLVTAMQLTIQNC